MIIGTSPIEFGSVNNFMVAQTQKEIRKNGKKKENSHLIFEKYKIVKQMLVIPISAIRYQRWPDTKLLPNKKLRKPANVIVSRLVIN
jgi:hypothetical protein